MKIKIDPTIRKWPSYVNSETKPALRLTELDDTNLTHQGGQQKFPLIKDIVGNQVCKFGGLHLDPRLSKKDCWFNNSSVSLLFISDMIRFFFCPPSWSIQFLWNCNSTPELPHLPFTGFTAAIFVWALGLIEAQRDVVLLPGKTKQVGISQKKKHASILYNIWWHIIIII